MRLLLVDDHVLFREGVVLLLRSAFADVEVVEAGSCEEAFTLLDTRSDYQLVLLDLNLPGLGGLEGIAVMRDRHPAVPIVALSSEDDRTTVMRALEAGAMGFVPKSSSSSVFAGAMRLILANGIYLPPSAFLGERDGMGMSAPARAPSGSPSPSATTPRDLGLTPRQADVLFLILQGKSAKLISRELGLSSNTIKSHTSACLRALNVTTRTQAVIAAGRCGLVFPALESMRSATS